MLLKRSSFLFFCLFTSFFWNPNINLAQDSLTLKIIKGLNRYRDIHLFNGDLFDTSFFKLTSKIDQSNTSFPPGEIIDLIYTYTKWADTNFIEVCRVLKRYCDLDLKKMNFQRSDLETVLKHGHFLNMVSNGFISMEPPFKLIYDTVLYEEFKFCHLNSLDKVIEIGAGDGFFSVLLGMIYNNQSIILTELNSSYLKFIDRDLDYLKSYKLGTIYKSWKGSSTSTGLEDSTFDKIIIRNTFHHFRKKDMMLQSIMKSMNDESELIILEPFKKRTSNNKTIYLNEDFEVKLNPLDNHSTNTKDSINELGNKEEILTITTRTDTIKGVNYSCSKKIYEHKFLKYIAKHNLKIIEKKKIGELYAYRIKKARILEKTEL